MEGFALQTFVRLHGVYGGMRNDPLMPDWPTPDEHVPEADMLRPLVERVMEATAAARAPWMAAT